MLGRERASSTESEIYQLGRWNLRALSDHVGRGGQGIRSADTAGRVREVLQPSAQSIHAKSIAMNELDLTPIQRARLLEAISDDIKEMHELRPPRVSRAALEQVRHSGIDLRSKNWHDQPLFDPGRKVLHLDHMVPVSAIRAACLREYSESGVLDILKRRLCVVCVLKSEDRELTRGGVQSRRPNPEDAYREATSTWPASRPRVRREHVARGSWRQARATALPEALRMGILGFLRSYDAVQLLRS